MKEVERLVRAGSVVDLRAPEELTNEEKVDEQARSEEAHAQDSSTSSCRPTTKFGNLHFRAKLKARGRPKRTDKQLLSFNKTSADRVGAEGGGRGWKRKLGTQRKTASKCKRCEETDDVAHLQCPVCAAPITVDEVGFMMTDCCRTAVHVQCFEECQFCN